jgi:hypothetical protein
VLSDKYALDLAPFTVEKTDRVFVKPTMLFARTPILQCYQLGWV